MIATRVIPRFDVKGENLVKGIHLEGLRIIGKPEEYAVKYDAEGADEIIVIDTVASLYGRDNLINIVKKICADVFIPVTAGGGIRTLDDIFALLTVGVDKVCINTAAVLSPQLINESAKVFGNQCIVISIEAMKKQSHWEAYTSNARESTGLDVVEWAKQAESLGAGEILLTSIDRDGTRQGFDLELISAVSRAVSVPVIASGGAGTARHVIDCIRNTGCHAVALASLFHYNLCSVTQLKHAMATEGLNVRLTE